MHTCRLSLHSDREVAADFAVREVSEPRDIANLDALHIHSAVLDLALPDDRNIVDISAAIKRRLRRFDLAAQDPDAVGQQAIGNQREVIFGIDVRNLGIQNLAVAGKRARCMDARALVLARHIDLVGRCIGEIHGARDIFERERAAVHAPRHARLLEDDLAREARAARGFRRDVRDVPRAISAALDRRFGACDGHGLDGRRRIIPELERRKQAQVHPGLRGPDDALRLVVINRDIVERGVMK